MADDELVSGVAITGLTPALGQQVFVLRAQHRESLDLLEMTVDAGFGRNNRPGDGAGHGQRLPLVSKRNYQRAPSCQVNFETLLFSECQRAKRQNSCCSWGGLCKPTATRANSAPPNGWRSAFLPAPTRSLGPRPRSPNFKQRPVAPHRKPSGRLKRVGIWFGSDRRLMDEASRSA